MNIRAGKLDVDGLNMSVNIPITIENNAYLENISDTEGLRFSDILEKMIQEHKRLKGVENGGKELEGNGRELEENKSKEESSGEKNRKRNNKNA